MRLIELLVPDEDLDALTRTLEQEDVDYVCQRAWNGDEKEWLVEFPLPTDAQGHIQQELQAADIDMDRYRITTQVESATTPTTAMLEDRFARDFDPLVVPELRSKARDMSRDWRSFLAMLLLSSIIATGGLLVGSSAVVVGSMVIAPIVGPVLTAAVGGVTGDEEMLLHSVWMQAAGLLVALAGATAFGLGLQVVGVFPSTLAVTSLDLIGLRVAPTTVTLAVGLASGAAAGYGLTTKGPTSLIGVMIAAALIPAGATVGIALAWGEFRVAAGAALVLLVSLLLVNLGAYAVLRRFYDASGSLLPTSASLRRRFTVGVTAVLVVALLGAVGVATAQQLAFESTVNEQVSATFEQPAYGDLSVVSVTTEYESRVFDSPATVTVVATGERDTPPPGLADAVQRRLAAATDREVAVRIHVETYQRAGSDRLAPRNRANARSVTLDDDAGARGRIRPGAVGTDEV